MFWNPFSKKQAPTSKKQMPDSDRVDETANRLAAAGQVDRIEPELDRLRLLDLTPHELESWHHLHGICALQRGDHTMAMQRFQAGLEVCPDSREICFSLGQEYLYAGQAGTAFELFDSCRFPSLSSAFVMAISRYAYLFGEYERGITAMLDFFPVYHELRILDDTFLYIRRLPFFSRAWANLATHCVLGGRTVLLTEETENIQRCCRDFNSAYLNAMLDAVLTGNYSVVVDHVKGFLAAARRYPGPIGMYEVQIAVLEAFAAGDYATAVQRISSVQLSSKDFKWLPDMLTVANAKVADTFENANREQATRRTFLKKQSLLFEPEHAVAFNILDYQEKLKPEVEIVRLSNRSKLE